MDGPEKIILDISSDEDVGWGEGGLTSATDGGDAGGRDDGDWLAELLDEFEDKVDNCSAKAMTLGDFNNDKVLVGSINNHVVDDDDSDDVVVIDEIVPCKRRKVEKPTSVVVASNDDDDCVVLDGDPDKPVQVNNGGGDDDDSDELVLVSEKGQVACRDYPHSRHLCVKFSFNSSPHEAHCDLCHCYVCDSLAPCPHWGSGISSIDHCHATDKDEFWKSQRKSMKGGGIIAQPVVLKPIDSSLCVNPTDITQSTGMLNNVLNQGNFSQAVRPPGYSTIPSSTNNFMTTDRPRAPRPPSSMATTAAMHHKMLLSKCTAGIKYQQHSISQKSQSVGNANSRPTWRGPATSGGVMPNNFHQYASRNSHPPATRWPSPRYAAAQSLITQHRLQSHHQANHGVNNGHAGPSVFAHSIMGTGLVTPHASHHSQAPPPNSGVNANLAAPWSQWSSQNYVPNISGNSMPVHQYIAPQPHTSNGFPYMAAQTALQSNTAAESFQNPISYQHHLPFLDNTGNSLSDQSALPSPSNAAQVSQSPVLSPHVYNFSSLLENQIANQIQVPDQLHSQSKEGNGIETGGGGSLSSADIGGSWNMHTNETNKNTAESSQQQQLHETATPTPNDTHLQMLAEAADLGIDDWFLADDKTLGLHSLDVPLSIVPNNLQGSESSPINDSSNLFDF